MRSKFVGYYRPNESEFEELIRTALVCVDANVLLNLYRYSSDTRERLILGIEAFQERLWLPHQAGLEFHKNRLSVIHDQFDAYKRIRQILEASRTNINKELMEFSRHSVINIESLKRRFEKPFKSAIDWVAKSEAAHPSLDEEDPILERITELFQGRVGDSYNEERKREIYKEGEKRYAEETPPGYKDAKSKSGTSAFGDLLIWNQIIDKAISSDSSVIFITDDLKDDWWLRRAGKTVGPRPELVEEFHSRTGHRFYMYKTEQFIRLAKKPGTRPVPPSVLDEIRNVRIRLGKAFFGGGSFAVTGKERSDLVERYNSLTEIKIKLSSELENLRDKLSRPNIDVTQYSIESKEADRINAEIDSINSEMAQVTDSLNKRTSEDSFDTTTKAAARQFLEILLAEARANEERRQSD